jgi:SRSO17 transposase
MRKSSVNQNLLTLTSTIPTQRNPIKMRKKSRRTTHRRKNRKIKKEITSKRKWLEHKLSQTKQYCNTSFGFCSDPDQSKRKNFNHAITTLPSNLCTQPTNLAFHNLCINQQLPKGSKQLLGLNLSFCLTPRNFHENIKKTMLKLAYSVRTQHYLNSANAAKDSCYIPQIYLKNRSWNPPPASTTIEHNLTLFEKLLKKNCDILQRNTKTPIYQT